MSKKTLRILLVEDSEHDLMAFRKSFQKSAIPCEIVHCLRAEDVLERLKTDDDSFDLIVSGYKLPGMSGLELFKELRRRRISLPVVMLTGSGSERLAVEALKAGVDDYLIKDPGQGYMDLLPVVLPEVVRKYNDRLARTRAEEALRKSEERLENILENFPGVVFWKDRNLTYLGCNKNFSVAAGLNDPSEIIGKTDYDLPWAKTEAGAYRKDDLAVIESGVPKLNIIETQLQADGRIAWFDTNKVPLFDSAGNVIGVLGTSNDITERKKTEEALQDSKRQLEDIINFLPDATFAVDLEGRVTLWNRTAEKLTGVKAEDILGKNDHEYAIPFYGVKRPLLLDHVLNPSEEIERLYPYVKREDGMIIGEGYTRSIKRGEAYMLGIAAPLYDSKGNVAGAIESIRDITERKRDEEELRRTRDELEQRVMARTSELSLINKQLAFEIEERKWAEGELSKSYEQLRKLAVHLQSIREEERMNIAREIHDELGQMLTALKIDLNWIKNRLPKDDYVLIGKAQSDLKLIDETIRSVKRICTKLRPDILDNLGLGAAIEWQAEEFQKRTGIKCKVAVDPENIVLDKKRSMAFFRIFQETLTNVMRHAKATEVKISLLEEDGKVVLTVMDNGIGITKDQLSKMNSFGLLGMRERVYPWAGEVEIAGVENEGTTVKVSIPAT